MAKIKVTQTDDFQMLVQTDKNGWAFRHNEAIDRPRGFEIPIVRMLHFWEMYAAQYAQRFDSPLGEDCVLGPEWRDIGLAIRGLLNGETGALDCGTLDSYILGTLQENSIDTGSL